MYFRGIRSADANGVVAFDSCFPGWYPGRAIHIHVRVRVNDAVYATSQLFFDDALVSEICASHPDYASHGQPDTTNDSDNIIGGVSDKSPYLLDVERMADGAMLASKTIMVQPGGPGCATAGGNG
jgi:protocatechuate 3,4-dioxygenase beta subunit